MSEIKNDAYDLDSKIDEYLNPHTVKNEKKHKSNKNRKPIEVLPDERFHPDPKNGLSTDQVLTRQAQLQCNFKGKQYSKSVGKIICSNLFTFFNLLCVICLAALLFVNSQARTKDEKVGIFNFTFVVIYAANLGIGIIQEIKAKKTIEKLSILNEPIAHVIRNGQNVDIPVTDIVLDDVVKFSTGNQITIDGTLLSGFLEVNESMLTGESVPVKKKVGDKILAGSFVVSGSASVIADKVGESRYIQTLSARAKKFKKPSSELMTTLQWIIKCIGILIIPISIGVLLTNKNVMLNAGDPAYALNGKLTQLGTVEMVKRTTSVVLGMIPSGMFLLTTLALAVGVIRLAGKNTSVQDMYALEMLARVDVLCLDKTGTITDGRMRVSNCVLFNSNYKYSINDIVSSMQYALDDNNQTSTALRSYFGSEKKLVASKTIPFSSARKYSAVSFTDGLTTVGTFALGAPEFILDKNSIPRGVANQIRHYTAMGQRVLMLAQSDKAIIGDQLPYDMRPFAIVTLSDNIRRDAIKTIDWFKKNEVNVKVISGDNPVTVSEVAKRAGVEGADKYVSLEGMSEADVIASATKYNVFGRVTPEQKAILVKALKNAGHTVAMTGDGVNDILAMKESDCSITVASGSDATKNIAHIVLMDNNFNSMPHVVAEGRRVINNIEKSSSLFLMKTLFTMVFAIISIARKAIFPFDSQMMMLLELMVIGIGSFFLSMQANTNKVNGKFVSYLFSHAIPGACILIFNVLIVEWLADYCYGPDTFVLGKMKDTLNVAALTLGGIANLHIISKPYNAYRAILVSFITIASLIFMCSEWLMSFMKMPSLLFDIKHYWGNIAVLIALVNIDITLGTWLTRLIEYITKPKHKKIPVGGKKK